MRRRHHALWNRRRAHRARRGGASAGGAPRPRHVHDRSKKPGCQLFGRALSFLWVSCFCFFSSVCSRPIHHVFLLSLALIHVNQLVSLFHTLPDTTTQLRLGLAIDTCFLMSAQSTLSGLLGRGGHTTCHTRSNDVPASFLSSVVCVSVWISRWLQLKRPTSPGSPTPNPETAGISCKAERRLTHGPCEAPCGGMPVCSKTLRSTRVNYTADSCPCSLGGCTSLWPCTASRLCFKHDLPSAAVAASHRAAALGSFTASSDLGGDGDGGGRGSHGVTYLFFLSFNRSLVRNAFASNPWKARAREVNRVLWFMHTARAVGVRPSRRHPIAPAA